MLRPGGPRATLGHGTFPVDLVTVAGATLARAVRPPAAADLAPLRAALERRLGALLPPGRAGDTLAAAMRHALLTPGKRIRPLLVLLVARELGRDDPALLDPACALELVHAASLVLDDLPAMDDAATRRGLPSTHAAFGENVAVLAAIALLGSAFRLLAASPAFGPGQSAAAVAVLAEAIGPDGLAGGQLADLGLGRRVPSADRLAEVNERKTGSLFVAAAEIGALAAAAPDGRRARMRGVAVDLGQAFQLLDDLADGDGADPEDAGKATLVALLGRDEAARRLERHLADALGALRPGGELATFVRRVFAGAGTKARPTDTRTDVSAPLF